MSGYKICDETMTEIRTFLMGWNDVKANSHII